MLNSLVTIRLDRTVFERPYVMFKSSETGWYNSALHVVLADSDPERIQSVVENERPVVSRAITILSDPASTVHAGVEAIVFTQLDLTHATFKSLHGTR